MFSGSTSKPETATSELIESPSVQSCLSHCEQTENQRRSTLGKDSFVSAAASYLDNLNPEQRRAVEHGAAGPGPFVPLLVIAGAGSGKTNTLAHRVAHLIVNGADPGAFS